MVAIEQTEPAGSKLDLREGLQVLQLAIAQVQGWENHGLQEAAGHATVRADGTDEVDKRGGSLDPAE